MAITGFVFYLIATFIILPHIGHLHIAEQSLLVAGVLAIIGYFNKLGWRIFFHRYYKRRYREKK